MTNKRLRGQFFTRGNPFCHPAFIQWAAQAGLPHKNLLEPFAGAAHIIHTLQAAGLCQQFQAYDVEPAHADVIRRDTLAHFPTGHTVCVTNPPWLSKNSATRRGYAYPCEKYDDLYKHCLHLCLQHCDHVAAIIPASYLQSNLFFDRLHTYILLHQSIFTDTDNPVCLALFSNKIFTPIQLYDDEFFIGTLEKLQSHLPRHKTDKKMRFNDPHGQLGFISFDNTKTSSIHFCQAQELSAYEIKESSRFITRISGSFDDADVEKIAAKLNFLIEQFRRRTHDVFLTPFKGVRKDGKYRRRMKFSLARQFINAV